MSAWWVDRPEPEEPWANAEVDIAPEPLALGTHLFILGMPLILLVIVNAAVGRFGWYVFLLAVGLSVGYLLRLRRSRIWVKDGTLNIGGPFRTRHIPVADLQRIDLGRLWLVVRGPYPAVRISYYNGPTRLLRVKPLAGARIYPNEAEELAERLRWVTSGGQ